MVYDTARKLAEELRASEEYRSYLHAREEAFQNDTTKALIAEYQKLQVRMQAAMLTGSADEEMMQKLQKLGELLQFDAAASRFLIAEYRIKTMLGDVYKILAEAVEIDLSVLEQ